MIKQRNTFLWLKLNGLLRYALTHCASKVVPYYIITEYPKSGGSWIGEMLAEGLGISFPRNRLPMLRPSIMHGHMWHNWNMHNVLCVWRDGRDVLISQYYHWLFQNDKGNQLLVNQTRADLLFADYDDIEENLPYFIKYVYEKKKHPRFSWSDFVHRWYNEGRVHIKYEEMRQEPVFNLCRITRELSGHELDPNKAGWIVDQYSFAKMSGRKAGEQKNHSFMRKGIVGDWQNHFSPKARELFHYYAGEELISLGYEHDGSWV